MKSHTGGMSRAALSYDMTFFAMLRLALSEEDYRITKRRCAMHPMHKRPMMRDNEALSYAAYIGAYLAYYKLRDTIADEHGTKKAVAVLFSPLAGGMKKAARHIIEPKLAIDTAMADIVKIETENCAFPDEPADIFGKMLGELLSYGLKGEKARIAMEIGLHTGRWVYLADAICDYKRDCKNGAYNPFIYAYTTDEMQAFLRDGKDGVLSCEIVALSRAVNLIDFGEQSMLHACIQNIMTDGMQSSFELAYRKEYTNGSGSL